MKNMARFVICRQRSKERGALHKGLQNRISYKTGSPLLTFRMFALISDNIISEKSQKANFMISSNPLPLCVFLFRSVSSEKSFLKLKKIAAFLSFANATLPPDLLFLQKNSRTMSKEYSDHRKAGRSSCAGWVCFELVAFLICRTSYDTPFLPTTLSPLDAHIPAFPIFTFTQIRLPTTHRNERNASVSQRCSQ